MKIAESGKNYSATVAEVGNEKILYVVLPYLGCSRSPRCLFCGVSEREDKSIKPDKTFGREVLSIVKELVNEYLPDSVVLYMGGNILRSEEMFQPAILEEIPRFVSEHATCQALEIESRADDIWLYRESIQRMKRNLKGKKLRVRLGIEYFDDKLLWRHRKGVTQGDVIRAVNFLNESGIQWNGYVMLGGLDLNQKAARISAVKTARFMVDNSAFKISINGMFTTRKLEKEYGRRVYVPTYSDLVAVIGDVLLYFKNNKKTALLKVGFEEEDIKCIVRLPFASAEMGLEELNKKISLFNKTQDIESLKTN